MATEPREDMGVPASPSGYSAEPEPSCTVSAVPVSIPNAMREVVKGLTRYIDVFLPSPKDYHSISQRGIAREVLVGFCVALDGAASAIEAGTAETVGLGPKDESAAPQEDAHE